MMTVWGGMRNAVVACAVLACGMSAARADMVMRSKVHVNAMQIMGREQPAKDTEHVIWFGKDCVRSDNERFAMVLRADQKKVFMLFLPQKMYQEWPLEGVTPAAAPTGPQAAARGGAQGISVKIEPTSETKKVGSWNCRKYLQTVQTPMGNAQSEIWATEDLKVDTSLLSQMAVAQSAMMPSQGQSKEQLSQEMAKIKGVPVLTNTRSQLMGTEIVSSTELVECVEKPAPKGWYDVPSDFTRQDNAMAAAMHAKQGTPPPADKNAPAVQVVSTPDKK